MAAIISTKPYMIRAIHEWCVDNGMTPHLLVRVNRETRVPMAYVKNGEIVLNLNYAATKDLFIANDAITFSARFGGVSQDLYVPINAVRGIFSRENGQGMFFEEDVSETSLENQEVAIQDNNDAGKKEEEIKTKLKKPSLKLVK